VLLLVCLYTKALSSPENRERPYFLSLTILLTPKVNVWLSDISYGISSYHSTVKAVSLESP
jgi:hypothetical protein